MLFNSLEFMLVFLPIVLLAYYFLSYLQYTRLALGLLTIASLVFYAYWDIKYIILLAGSILFNYSVGKLLAKKNCKAYSDFGDCYKPDITSLF